MLVDFNALQERTVPGMNGGTGEMTARMFADAEERIVYCRIHPGGSIGTHTQGESDDINYVLSGRGKAICDGMEEVLVPGVCHICKKGSEHSIINTGKEDLVLLTVVVAK